MAERIDPELRRLGKLSADRWLLETAFVLILNLQPGGPHAAFRTMADEIRAKFRQGPANPNAVTPGEVTVSDESERQILQFVERLGRRIRSA